MKGQPDACYEKLKASYVANDLRWCLTRGGAFIRWLNEYEVTMIESVLEHCGEV